MQELLEAVKRVKQTIQQHTSELKNNEALTRYALVDIILLALGWDVHNPAKVIPEYTKDVGGRADYVFLNGNAEPVALLEAKPLGGLSQKDLIQVTNYAFNSGIKYSIASDGNVWIVADAYKQIHVSQKEIMRLELDKEPENLLLIKLACLLPANIFAGNQAFFPKVDIPQHITSEDSKIIEPSPKIVNKKQIQMPPAVKNGSWQPLPALSGTNKLPSGLKFPDGQEVTVQSASNFLTQVAEWLVKSNKLSKLPVEDKAGKQRYLISSSPVHKNGVAFKGVKQLSNGAYLQTHYDTTGCIQNALWLITQLGESPDKFYFS